MADPSKIPLDASKTTQEFSATSTIEQYDYKVRNTELGLLNENKYNIAWEEHNQSIQLCMKKLNALNLNTAVNKIEIDNCFAKLRRTFDMISNN